MEQFLMLLFAIMFSVTVRAAVVGSTPTEAALAFAQGQNKPISRAIDSIFTKLPSENDVQSIIFTADGLALTKLLQTIEIKEGEIACDALAVYSDQIIGMIKVVL